MVENAIEEMGRKVRYVHIGTHTLEIHNGLRRIFEKTAQWTVRFDFDIASEYQTTEGRVPFRDGVLSYANIHYVRKWSP